MFWDHLRAIVEILDAFGLMRAASDVPRFDFSLQSMCVKEFCAALHARNVILIHLASLITRMDAPDRKSFRLFVIAFEHSMIAGSGDLATSRRIRSYVVPYLKTVSAEVPSIPLWCFFLCIV
jgi:hypothetical protein